MKPGRETFLDKPTVIHENLNLLNERMKLVRWVNVLIFLDLFGVALVVPLLASYFRDAGISTKAYASFSSLYSGSQFIGGLFVGFISDSVPKRDILTISYLGCAMSYLVVCFTQQVGVLVASRILVGLLKHSLDTSTAIITECTGDDAEVRAQELARVSASGTFSWIVGPLVGSFLYKIHAKLPPLTAGAIFIFSTILSSIVIPRDLGRLRTIRSSQYADAIPSPETSKLGLSIFRRLFDLCKLPFVGVILASRLLFSGFDLAFSPRLMLNFHEKRFGVATSDLGFLESLKAGLSIFANLYLFAPTISILRYGNANVDLPSKFTVVGKLLLLNAVVSMAEYFSCSFGVFLTFVLTPQVIVSTITSSALKSLFTEVIPASDIGKALAITSVLTSMSNVLAPLYSNAVYGVFSQQSPVAIRGLLSCSHHLALGILVLIFGSFKRSTVIKHKEN